MAGGRTREHTAASVLSASTTCSGTPSADAVAVARTGKSEISAAAASSGHSAARDSAAEATAAKAEMPTVSAGMAERELKIAYEKSSRPSELCGTVDRWSTEGNVRDPAPPMRVLALRMTREKSRGCRGVEALGAALISDAGSDAP